MEILQQQNPNDADPDESPQRPGSALQDMLRGESDAAPSSDTTDFEFEDTEDVDVRGTVEPDQVIAEWLSDQPLDGEVGRTSKPGRRAARVRNAQDVAERAVNDSVVPPRYHEFIKRYFKNLNQTVEKATTDPPAASDTKPSDAESSSDTEGAKPARESSN